MTPKPLVLASSSPYRKALLERLGIPFESASPNIDEAAHTDENAEALTLRLAMEKASALRERFPDHWIIGSDQVAALDDNTILTKPGNLQNARAQLRHCSGHHVRFLTGLALLDSATGEAVQVCEPFDVHFRRLSDEEIEHYLLTETPYDCAGSFRMEGLGIALFERLDGRDPNSLVGLPLIGLCDIFRQWGLNPLTEAYRNSNRD